MFVSTLVNIFSNTRFKYIIFNVYGDEKKIYGIDLIKYLRLLKKLIRKLFSSCKL